VAKMNVDDDDIEILEVPPISFISTTVNERALVNNHESLAARYVVMKTYVKPIHDVSSCPDHKWPWTR
jgi:hypothetical protein